MKLGFVLAVGARASFFESFELIPDGYQGSYQNWNVTQLLVENEDDELFQAFEEEVSTEFKICLKRPETMAKPSIWSIDYGAFEIKYLH